MATISALGVGSGMDMSTIIKQLMTVEQQPLTVVNQQESSIKSKISAYGQLSSALSALKTAATALNTPTTINAFKAAFSDNAFGTATASSSAAAGVYDIQVTQLAKAHTLATTAFASNTTVVGDGSLTIKSGTNTFSVTIDNTNDTLAGIRDAINASANNTSVSASIVNDTSGARLVLSAKNTGSANAIDVQVTESGAAGLRKLSYASANGDPYGQVMTAGNPAQDALLKVNGVPISSASNTVSSAITGVSFTLAKENSSATLTITRDSAAVSTAATNFAAAYSKLSSTIKTLTAYDAATKTGSVLTGDGTTSMLMSRLRTTLSTVPSGLTGTYSTLAEVGISIQSDGSMSVDSTKLQSAIDNHFSDLQNVLGTYGKAVSDFADSFTNANGVVTARVDGLNTSIRRLEDRKTQIQARLDRVEANYKRQYSALDALLGSMNTTSSYLSQQLARL